MKRILSIVLAVAMSLGTMPFAAFAAVDSQTPEFQTYLDEIGMNEEEFITYLNEFHQGSTLEEFENFEDLQTYLGELIDEENLQELLVEMEISDVELHQLLEENGKNIEEYIFIGDLYSDVSKWLYPEVQTPITDESLQTLLEEYEFSSQEELEAFLNEFDDSIYNYTFIEELEMAISEYYVAQAEEELTQVMDSFGLTMEEAEKLAEYFISIMEDPAFNDENFLASLEDISNRLMNFSEFESASELTAEQIAEFIDIWDDLLNLFDLKVDYFLTIDGKVTPISFAALVKMDNINGADLLIKIYTKSGELLADMIITKEMFGSDLIEETGKNIEDTKNVAEDVKKVIEKAPSKTPVKTVNGGKLPNTASNYLQNTMAGLSLVLLGAIVLRRVKTRRA